MSPEYKYYKTVITAAAEAQGLDPILVGAVAQTESSCRTDAFRHEPQFWLRYMKPSPKYAHLNPRRYSSSYGLMQPMWVVAVEEGFDPSLPPEHLFVPELSLEYGCKRLKKCLEWADGHSGTAKDRLLSGLAAYNGGRNSAQAPPNPRNIKYALKVWSYVQELTGL